MPVAVLSLICFNTVVMAIEHHRMPQSLRNFSDITNAVMTGVFTLELLVKLVALYPREFFKDNFTVFDTFLVVFSLVELPLSGRSSFTAFRSLRVFRVLRLLIAWPLLRALLNVVGSALLRVFLFFLLLLLVMLIYALLGMQLFGGILRTASGGGVPRQNFDTFFGAILSVIQVLTLEDWYLVYADCVAATTWGAAFYFVTLILIGKYVLLNLFAAVILQAFAAQARLLVSKDTTANVAHTTKLLSLLTAEAEAEHINLETAIKSPTEALREAFTSSRPAPLRTRSLSSDNLHNTLWAIESDAPMQPLSNEREGDVDGQGFDSEKKATVFGLARAALLTQTLIRTRNTNIGNARQVRLPKGTVLAKRYQDRN